MEALVGVNYPLDKLDNVEMIHMGHSSVEAKTTHFNFCSVLSEKHPCFSKEPGTKQTIVLITLLIGNGKLGLNHLHPIHVTAPNCYAGADKSTPEGYHVPRGWFDLKIQT
jgi:hypothetical protein